MHTLSHFRRLAESAWEFFWLAVLAGALWFAAFVFPITPAMAATPTEVGSFATGLAASALIIALAIVAASAIYGAELWVLTRLEERRARGIARDSAAALEAYGDASLLDRRP